MAYKVDDCEDPPDLFKHLNFFRMKIDMKSPEMQPLLDDIRALNEKHKALLSNLDLKISLKSTLSSHDQVVNILAIDFNVPIEIVNIVFEYLPLTYLIDKLGASFDQVISIFKTTTYEKIKNELIGIGGYKINKNGTVHLT